MLIQHEKDKLMKQISIIVVLLGIAYGVSFLASDNYLDKELTIEDTEEQVLARVKSEDLMASLDSLREEDREKVRDMLNLSR